MKKLLLATLLAFSFQSFVLAQDSRTDKAKIVINKYLETTIDDYDSYSPVSYGSIDSLFTNIESNPDYIKAIDRLLATKDSLPHKEDITSYFFDVSPLITFLDKELEKETNKKARVQILSWQIAYMEFKIAQVSIKNIMRAFKPDFEGWKLTHKYRAKNQYNATVLYEKEFHFDENITTVKEVIEIPKK